ncbi:MAG: Bax inhibitor-1/YccA family protein [Pseudomonadota bacterium]
MSDWNDTQRQQGFGSVPRAGGSVTHDEGLRKHMLGVYNYMGAAVALTGLVALFVAQTGLVRSLIGPTGEPSLLYWASVALPFILVMWLQFRIFKMSVATAQAAYWAYAVLTGVSISFIFIVYTPVSIAQTFLATAIAFAGLSLWGYTTKKDLSGWGSFLIMGIWGGIALSLLNVLFFKSQLFDLAMSFAFLLMFAGFVAYKTQETREIYLQLRGNTEMLQKATIYGALHLYMSFISIFMNLLRFMGSQD